MNCIAVRAMSKIGFADSNIGRRKFKRIGLKKDSNRQSFSEKYGNSEYTRHNYHLLFVR